MQIMQAFLSFSNGKEGKVKQFSCMFMLKLPNLIEKKNDDGTAIIESTGKEFVYWFDGLH